MQANDSEPYTPQRTLRHAIGCVGVGLHSGARVAVTLHPADIDHGIRFRRADRPGTPAVPAGIASLVDGPQGSGLIAAPGPRIGAVEHLMGAFAACGITNALVDIGGPELPAMDGSAQPFIFLIECAGLVDQPAPRAVIEIRRRVSVAAEGGWVAIEPADAMILDCSVDTGRLGLGVQSRVHRFEPDLFRAEIAPARAFACAGDLDQLRAEGQVIGGSPKNLVLVDDGRVVNPEGLRFADELVRHWILDCVGDLYLAGGLPRGRLVARRASRGLVARLLRTLQGDPTAWSSSLEAGATAMPRSAPAAAHA